MQTHLFSEETEEPQTSPGPASPARGTQSSLEAILHAAPDAMLALDEQARITIANPAVASIFGLQPEQMAGMALASVLPGITAEAAAQRTADGLYMRASRTWVSRFETTALRHDGTPFPAEVSLSRTDGEEGALYACVVRDVTEQRMSLAMLNLYSQALDCTSNGVVISDMTLPGQPVFYANPAFHRITGFDPGEAIGRNCGFLQRGDTAQPEIDVLRQAVVRGEGASVVLRNYRKDGTLFFNELAISPVTAPDGVVRHYVGVLNDVTERERARLAIAERSARLNAVFDLSPDGFVVFDRDGRLVYTNRAFVEMTGLQLVGGVDELGVEDFDHHFAALCDPAAPCRRVADVLEDDSGSVAETLYLQRPERRVLARVVRSHAADGGESILFFRDVTRETEVDRMKSEFLTTAAHELRTPMVSVFGFTELLLNRPVNEERRRDMLETIHRHASLLINMVNELLDLARIEARQGKDMKPRLCSFSQLVEQAVGSMMVTGDARCVQVTLDHREAELLLDPDKTLRALTNVLSNAYKYSPRGGEIALRTHEGEVDGRPMVGVTVRDQGIGMSTQECQRVFERFYRADPSGNIPGTGLGMSLVKEIVELQGGRVDLDSAPGQGTAVTMWFPAQPTPVGLPRPLAGAAAD
jgi:PAS domain S-box-containing protein